MFSPRLNNYVRYAADHGRFAATDPAANHAAYDSIQREFRELARNGEGGLLFDLYDHENPEVQVWAAGHTLEIDEARALSKLEQLQHAEIPHVSTAAEYTILEWKAGNLRFLPR